VVSRIIDVVYSEGVNKRKILSVQRSLSNIGIGRIAVPSCILYFAPIVSYWSGLLL
jgi:hypothetical protein